MWGKLSSECGTSCLGAIFFGRVVLGQVVFGASCPVSSTRSELLSDRACANLTAQLTNLRTAIAQTELAVVKIMKTTANGPRLEQTNETHR